MKSLTMIIGPNEGDVEKIELKGGIDHFLLLELHSTNKQNIVAYLSRQEVSWLRELLYMHLSRDSHEEPAF